MANALRALIQFYRTGETADRVKYDIAWVADKSSPVDTINNFTEVYMDPRGIKGSWEALVFYVNPEKAKRIKALGAAGAVVRGPHAVRSPLPQAQRHRHRRQRDRRGHRNRRLGAGHADRHQPAERRADPRALRQQVGVAVERHRGVQRVDARRHALGVHVGRRRGGSLQALPFGVRRTAHGAARSARPRIGTTGTGLQGIARRDHQGTLLRARGGARRSDRALLHRRSQARRTGDRRLPPIARTSPARSTTITPATPSCSSGARARPRTSRKRTCATGR